MTPEARAALKALSDCGAISARWEHPGYRELRHRGLVGFRAIEGGKLALHSLNEKGRAMIARLSQ